MSSIHSLSSVIEYNEVRKATGYSFSVCEFIPNVSITLVISVFENTNLLKQIVYTIQGTEYENWGLNDNYLINLIEEKIRLSIVPVEVPAEVPAEVPVESTTEVTPP